MSGYIIKSIASASVFRALGILSSFVINVVLAHMLEPDLLGQYFLAFSMAMFLSIVMRFGLKQTVLRLVSKARLSGDSGCIADTILKVMVIVFMSIFIVTVILLTGLGEWIGHELFHSEEIVKNLAIIIFWAAMLSLAPPVGESLRGLKMPAWGAALDNSVSSFVALTIFTMLFIIGRSISLESVLIVSGAAVAIVVIVSARKLIIAGELLQSRKPCIKYRQIYIDTSPIFLVNLATYLTANASIWIVGYYLSHEEVAIYGAVLKLFNLIAVPLLVINLAIEPSIAEYIHENKRKHMDALLRISATVALLATIFISAIIFLWGDLLLTILFGAEYSQGYIALLILVLGNVVNVWSGSCASMMMLGGYQVVLTIIRVLFGLVSISMSMIFVSVYGIEGVALAVSVSVALSNIVTWKLVKNKMEYNTSATLNIKKRMFILGH